MLQHLIVFLIVSAAALYALWRVLPLAWRHGMARRLAASAHGIGLINVRQANQLFAALTQSSGCSSACDRCAGCERNKPTN